MKLLLFAAKNHGIEGIFKSMIFVEKAPDLQITG